MSLKREPASEPLHISYALPPAADPQNSMSNPNRVRDRSNRLLGAAFFILWTLIATVILLNVFVAIVIDAFDKVRGLRMIRNL